MRSRFFLFVVLFMTVFTARSQYYYKDLLLTMQNRENWISLHKQKVRGANIVSLDANNEPTPGFTCTQTISGDFSLITTFTKSADVPASTLVAKYDGSGHLLSTVDTSDTYKSTTDYTYNESGELTGLLNISLETDNHISASEKHIWIYSNGKPSQMIKIKGEKDTTFVSMLLDEHGNVIEEKAVRGKQIIPSVYYYYDNENRLTDIVQYNQKARRLLPDYVFEYNSDRISSMLFVHQGSTDYQKWVYSYDTNGLKKEEFCYDKKKQLIVKIIYTFSFQ
jgi:hypothetical protein